MGGGDLIAMPCGGDMADIMPLGGGASLLLYAPLVANGGGGAWRRQTMEHGGTPVPPAAFRLGEEEEEEQRRREVPSLAGTINMHLQTDSIFFGRISAALRYGRQHLVCLF